MIKNVLLSVGLFLINVELRANNDLLSGEKYMESVVYSFSDIAYGGDRLSVIKDIYKDLERANLKELTLSDATIIGRLITGSLSRIIHPQYPEGALLEAVLPVVRIVEEPLTGIMDSILLSIEGLRAISEGRKLSETEQEELAELMQIAEELGGYIDSIQELQKLAEVSDS